MKRRDAFPAVLFLSLVLFLRPAFAQRMAGPTFGACFATDGQGVETTYLDGGALFYPGPSETRITPTDDGFDLLTRTPFRDWSMRVYLPGVLR